MKVGCHRAKGQNRIEIMYWTQLCTDAKLPAVVGKWGGAVLKKTPIRM